MWFVRNFLLFKNWIALYSGSLHLKTRDGLTIDIPSRHDIPILHEVLAEKIYKDILTLKDPKLIIDIGAHVGTFSLFALKAFPNATVFSFEPSSKNFAYLKKNIEQNGFSDRCKTFNVAVAGERGIRTLNLATGGDNGHNSLFIHSDDMYSGTENVECITLDDILKNVPQCDFLKVDAEGAEGEILSHCSLIHKVGKMNVEGSHSLIKNALPEHNFVATDGVLKMI